MREQEKERKWINGERKRAVNKIFRRLSVRDIYTHAAREAFEINDKNIGEEVATKVASASAI